jgi:hypothetical protein
LVGWTVPANRANDARTSARVEVRPHIAATAFGAERRSHGMRRFIAALGRYRPLLVLGLSLEAQEDEVDTDQVLVVYRGQLDWAAVDRLSDGMVQAMLVSERELSDELARPTSLLTGALTSGPLLYGDPDLRVHLLQQAGLAVPEALVAPPA